MIRNALIFEGVMAQLLGLILVAALLSARPRSIANRLLALALACVVFRQFLLVMKISGVISSLPALFRLSFPLQLLAIPVFYLYAIALTTADFRLERKHIVHLLPFALGLAWYCAFLIWGGPAYFEPGTVYDRELYLRVVVKLLVIIPYLILVRRQVQEFGERAREHVSNVSNFQLTWLRTLLIVACASIAVDVLDVATGPEVHAWYLAPAVSLISLIVLAFVSLRVSPAFSKEVEYRKEESPPSIAEPPQKKDPKEDASKGRRLSDEELTREKARLKGLLEAQTLYLNPDLRLSDLATAMGVRPYRVTEILNQGMDTSFYDLINQYRITRARQLLTSKSSDHLNLLGVAMESGFRSKSVFNEVFKKSTGITPSQFRTQKMTESSNPSNRIAPSGR